MDTFIRIKGILKQPIYETGPWYTLWRLKPVETYKSMSFSASHKDDAELFSIIDKVMGTIMHNQGMSVVTDELMSTKKVDNLQFWPMHNFSHIEVETRLLSAPPVEGMVQ